MSQTTLTMTAGTWFQNNDSTNHSSQNWLKTTRRIGSNPYYGAILQFTIPNSLKYKRFTKAVVRYYTKFYNGDTEQTDRGLGGMWVAPYVCSNTALSQVTGASLDTYGEMGEAIEVDPWTTYGPTYPTWRNADVTGLFSSNLYNNQYFTVILTGCPGPSAPPVSNLNGRIGSVNSNYAAQLILDYEDVTQQPPTPSYPVGTYLNENTDIMFAWAWNSSTAAVQASVQLEYKLKTAANYTTVSLTQATHTYLLAGGLAQGTYQWRIKGTNDAGETSGYSEVAEFNVVGKPTAPVINSVPNKTLTAITWNTSDQNAFDVTLTDADGKELIKESVASAESSYKPNLFLKGTYTVGIRTRNSTGLVSDWSYKTFSIMAAGPTKPSILLLQNDAQAKISTSAENGINYAVIRKEDRDGAPEEILGLMDAGILIDATFGFGIPYRYVVRAWSTGGYTDSDPERICYSKSAVVLETLADELVIDRSEQTYLPFVEDVNGDMAVFNCVGRELPIAEHGEYKSRIFKSRLYIRENQQERLVKMSKDNRIFYRDYSGRAFPVAIQPPISFERWMGDGYMAEITFVRIAETEVVVNV